MEGVLIVCLIIAIVVISFVLPNGTVVTAVPAIPIHHDFLRGYVLVLQGVVRHEYVQLSFQLLMIHVIVDNLFSDYAAIATLETILPIIAYRFFVGWRWNRFFRWSLRRRRRCF